MNFVQKDAEMAKDYACRLTLILAACFCMMQFGVSNAVLAQESSNLDLGGKWLKYGTGDTIEFKSNGDLDLFLSGQAASFSGNGSFIRCTDGGANVCITGNRLKCAYRYAVVQGQLNLQFRSGAPDVACRAAAGDFRKTR